MKRFVFVLLAGVLGLSAVTALALRQGPGRQGTVLPELKPESQAASQPASQVASRQIQVPAAASCDPAGMLLAIQEEIEIGAPLIWESVTIKQCRNGYARVLAHPGNVPPDSNVESSEQVFLNHSGHAWKVITSGTGIACSDQDRSSELQEACEGLGLS
ncbi:MAG: hypothetical protein ACRDHO_01060 [Actinomycetota bacterium]